MRHIDSVCACTDLTDASRTAVEYAAWIAARRGAALQLVSVVEPPERIYDYFQDAIEDVHRAEITATLTTLAEALKREHGVEAQIHTPAGSPVPEILRIVAETGSDVVVCGRHKTTGWDQVSLGSVAERLVYKAPCDVILATAGLVCGGGPIALATDFSESSSAAAERLAELTRRSDEPSALLIHGFDVPRGYSAAGTSHEQALESVRERHTYEFKGWLHTVDLEGISTELVLGVGRPAEVVAQALKESGANLCLLGAEGRTVAATAVLGRVARRIVHHAPCTVWVVRPESRRLTLLGALRELMGLRA